MAESKQKPCHQVEVQAYKKLSKIFHKFF